MKSRSSLLSGNREPEPIHVGVSRSPFVYQSAAGRYFVARTGVFSVPAGNQAIALFENPTSGGRRAFLVVITLTSDRGRRAFFYYDLTTDATLLTSDRMANIHRGASGSPTAGIRYGSHPQINLLSGIDAFERLLEGGVTLNTEQAGRFIFEPGHTFGVHFPAIDAADELDVALGWWEEDSRVTSRG